MTLPKPAHLTPEHAARFQHPSVVGVYHLRAPYPAEVFDHLLSLVTDAPRVVLDVGTGTGEIARPLAPHVERVDAVDQSRAMLARGRQLPGGDLPQLHWIEAPIEQAPLQPPYALITAGESLHWMHWEVVLPRFAQMSTPHGYLAIVHREEVAVPWQDGLQALIRQYSTMYNYQPFDLVEELERRGLFAKTGEYQTPPTPFTQSVEDYIAAFHSRSSLSLAAMPAEDAAAFDARLREMVAPWSADGLLGLQTQGSVVWGKALEGSASGT